jgi:hypothetical protein
MFNNRNRLMETMHSKKVDYENYKRRCEGFTLTDDKIDELSRLKREWQRTQQLVDAHDATAQRSQPVTHTYMNGVSSYNVLPHNAVDPSRHVQFDFTASQQRNLDTRNVHRPSSASPSSVHMTQLATGNLPRAPQYTTVQSRPESRTVRAQPRSDHSSSRVTYEDLFGSSSHGGSSGSGLFPSGPTYGGSGGGSTYGGSGGGSTYGGSGGGSTYGGSGGGSTYGGSSGGLFPSTSGGGSSGGSSGGIAMDATCIWFNMVSGEQRFFPKGQNPGKGWSNPYIHPR